MGLDKANVDAGRKVPGEGRSIQIPKCPRCNKRPLFDGEDWLCLDHGTIHTRVDPSTVPLVKGSRAIHYGIAPTVAERRELEKAHKKARANRND